MLKVLYNRMKEKSENILSEEQAGFRPHRSMSEQIFNLGLINEKLIQHQCNLFRNLIDFTKAFDRVWHGRLWQL
jgi:hypothetical protein